VTLHRVGKRDREQSARKSKCRPNAPAHKVGPDSGSDPLFETRRRAFERPKRPCSAPARFIGMFAAALIERRRRRCAQLFGGDRVGGRTRNSKYRRRQF
jgi:hypothetical protein